MAHLGKLASAAAAALFVATIFAAAAQSPPAQSAASPGLSGTALKMMNPKYSSRTRDGGNYEVTAASAVQMRDGDGETELEQPRVQLGFANGIVLGLFGTTGLLRPRTDSLAVRGNAVLVAASGRTIFLGEAIVDLRSNTLASETPIVTASGTEVIHARRLEVSERGVILIVEGSISRPEGVIYFDRYLLE